MEVTVKKAVGKQFVGDYRSRSCCGQFTFTWATGLLLKGFKEELSPDELWDIDDKQSASHLHKKLKETWEEQVKKPKDQRSLQTAMLNTFGFQLFVTVMCMFAFYAQQLFTAGYIFPSLIRTLGDPNAEMIQLFGTEVPLYALIYALAFALCETSRSILQNNMWYRATILGVGMQVATRELMYEKLTKLRYGQIAYGRVLNIISTDTARLQMLGQYGHFVIHSAAYLILIAIVCTITFGPAVLVGLITMILFIPIQGRVGKILGQIRQKAAKVTDHRVSLMSEILKAMKLIKLYAWEDRFSSEINMIRGKETAKMQSAAVIVACNNVIGATSIFFVMAITFSVHVLLGNKLDAPSAFSVLALFNTARFPLVVLALATRLVAEGRIGLKRMTELLNEDEMLEVEEMKIIDKTEIVVNIQGDFKWPSTSADAALSVETKENANGNIKVKRDSNKQIDGLSVGKNSSNKTLQFSASNDSGTLKNIDLKVPNGALIGVAGPVGCGKSSLLIGAMLGHMDPESNGQSILKGKVALCMQEAWIFNGTVKENILFGLTLKQDRYDEVLKACALTDDLKLLPAGDQTEIGERGVK
jgi:ATP-binding cassette, subfamily C (CFTR/MRP), member 1